MSLLKKTVTQGAMRGFPFVSKFFVTPEIKEIKI